MPDICRKGSSQGRDALTPDMKIFIKLYEKSKAPVGLLSRNLSVLYANQAATELSPSLKMPDGVIQLLTGVTVEKIAEQLNGSLPVTLVSSPAMLSIHLTPINGGFIANFAPYVSQGTALYPQGQQQQVSALSGQLRKPLQNMFAAIASMRHLYLEDDNPEVTELISTINENAYKLLRTTLNLTEYIKMFSPESVVNTTKFDLCDMLDKLLSATGIVTGSSGVPLSYKLMPEPVIVKAEETLLAMAVLQVISNSCHFKKEGTSVKVSLIKTGGSAIITISDNGLGIPDEIKDKIFEPFFSFDHNGLPFAGVGLGLTIARSIMLYMGGSIQFISSEDEGTTVAISVPLADEYDLSLRSPQASVNYMRDRFSPLHVILSDACGCPTP